MRAGLAVRGGGPASRDSQLLNPLMAAQQIHAVVLSGGSAYGLGAANGVMKYLEEKDIGFDTGVAKVPLVAQSDIFDLSVGSADVRPDSEMGYAAARTAFISFAPPWLPSALKARAATAASGCETYGTNALARPTGLRWARTSIRRTSAAGAFLNSARREARRASARESEMAMRPRRAATASEASAERIHSTRASTREASPTLPSPSIAARRSAGGGGRI